MHQLNPDWRRLIADHHENTEKYFAASGKEFAPKSLESGHTCSSVLLRIDVLGSHTVISEGEWEQAVREFEELIAQGRTVEAIERFYADDVMVFENRALVRAGRVSCVRWERNQLERRRQSPQILIRSRATNTATRTAFFELVVRWSEPNERIMRLEEVLVQNWASDRISQERLYYDGIVDEVEHEPEPSTAMSWSTVGG